MCTQYFMINEGHCFFAAAVHPQNVVRKSFSVKMDVLQLDVCKVLSKALTVERVLTIISEYLTHFMVD